MGCRRKEGLLQLRYLKQLRREVLTRKRKLQNMVCKLEKTRKTQKTLSALGEEEIPLFIHYLIKYTPTLHSGLSKNSFGGVQDRHS